MPIVFLVLAPRADVGCSANFAMANFAVVVRFTTQLATGDTYRATCCAVREGICEAQVMRFIRVFTCTVQKRLSSTISFPRTEAARNAISRQFHQWSGMTGALGAVDGSHIPVSPPKGERGTYINRKGWYSIILSAVVDGRGRFLDISTGWPGRASDAAIIKEQALWERCERDGDRSWVPSPYFILGDSACVAPCHMSPLWQCASGVLLLRLSSATPTRYPHRRWLQKGFPAESAVGDDRRTEYNEAFSQTRVIVECAFGKLKGQWRCLHVGLRQKNPADWSKVVHCCCILHNITIDIGGQGWRRGPRHREYGTATYDHGAFDADPDGAVGGFGLHQQPVPRACPSAEAVRERLYEESCPARNYSQDGTRRAGVLRRRD